MERALKEALLRHNRNVPRYTSYPTAPHFQPVESGMTASLLEGAGAGPLSLYVHIPFCAEMCWYCGCHTTATRRYAPVEDYTGLLLREIALVRDVLPERRTVSALHFGGGSPSLLRPGDVARITGTLREAFAFLPDAEIAIEADPRGLAGDKVAAWADAGVTRASFGVQDFSPAVQCAINRVQSVKTVAAAVELCRSRGIRRVNFDLMYGLPLQTMDDAVETAKAALRLEPDRVALFGYAHVPWMKKHMRLIRDEDLPDGGARIDHFEAASAELAAGGLLPVGIDHFARAGDSLLDALAQRRLARNFQGYTEDAAGTLLGFGVSAIGRTSWGYQQNVANLTEYADALRDGRLPAARGCAVTAEDRLHAEVISDIMCYLDADLGQLLEKHGRAAETFDGRLAGLAPLHDDGLVAIEGRRLRVNPRVPQAARLAAAAFDLYLGEAQGAKRHVQAA